ncbi:YqzH family protein, partial [Bacillus inaquosorum]
MEKFVEKMMGQALRQYGRNVAIDPLSPYEKQ